MAISCDSWMELPYPDIVRLWIPDAGGGGEGTVFCLCGFPGDLVGHCVIQEDDERYGPSLD